MFRAFRQGLQHVGFAEGSSSPGRQRAERGRRMSFGKGVFSEDTFLSGTWREKRKIMKYHSPPAMRKSPREFFQVEAERGKLFFLCFFSEKESVSTTLLSALTGVEPLFYFFCEVCQ